MVETYRLTNSWRGIYDLYKIGKNFFADLGAFIDGGEGKGFIFHPRDYGEPFNRDDIKMISYLFDEFMKDSEFYFKNIPYPLTIERIEQTKEVEVKRNCRNCYGDGCGDMGKINCKFYMG